MNIDLKFLNINFKFFNLKSLVRWTPSIYAIIVLFMTYIADGICIFNTSFSTSRDGHIYRRIVDIIK